MGERHLNFSSDDILNGILNNDRKVLEYLYETYFSKVWKLVEKYQGTKDDAWDLFQETILQTIDMIKKEGFELKCSFSTFFASIYKRLWFMELRERGQVFMASLDTFDFPDIIDEEELIINQRENRFARIFARHYRKLDFDCKKVLRLTMKNIDGKGIIEKTNFTSIASAYNKRRKCLARLTEMILNDPEFNKLNDYEKL
ncbi:MAG: sigma factor [Bacteroidales bacterium]|nr:sigma factor [Bacteroidales bacterium]